MNTRLVPKSSKSPLKKHPPVGGLFTRSGVVLDISNLSVMLDLVNAQGQDFGPGMDNVSEVIEFVFDSLTARSALSGNEHDTPSLEPIPLSSVFRPLDMKKAAEWLLRLQNGQVGGQIDIEFVDQDAPSTELGMILISGASILVNGKDEVSVVFGERSIGRDFELKVDEARFASRIAERSRADFLANVTHELRTPLNAVIGFSSALQTKVYGDVSEKQLEALEFINFAGEHLLSLVNDILDLSKLDVNSLELRETKFDLRVVVEKCAALIRPKAVEGKVNLRCVLPDTEQIVLAEERIIKQLALNLVSNAVKFTESDGEVVVTVDTTSDGRSRVTVKDNGIGMEKADIPTALSRFGQIESANNRRFEGVGLGLPLVLAHAEIHDAEVTLESEPGIGTEVVVTFPAERTINT